MSEGIRCRWQDRRRAVVGHDLHPDHQVLVGHPPPDGLQRAHHHSRPDERTASHHAHRDHPGLRPAVGLVSLGRGQLGAQSARRRRRDDFLPGPEGRSPRDRAGSDAAVAFFRDTLGPVARTIPFGRAFIRFVDGTDLDKPEEAAEGRRVFELEPVL